MVFLKYRKNSM